MFFTDWSDFDVSTRMAAWDRKFKTLTSYPQVRRSLLVAAVSR